MSINIIDLGLKDYKETLNVQYDLIEKRKNNLINDTLILVEHNHVITAGRKTNQNNIIDKSLPIFYVERGGDVTYHGPGQLVGYPIIDISKSKDVNLFIRKIELFIINVLSKFQIVANTKEKHTGVWVDDKKIASIGIAFKNWISYHGFSINVNTNMSFFYKINPCGLEASVMTSMQLILNKEINIDEVKKVVSKLFTKYFDKI
ncbi:MAG: octanoyltransferase [Candidatus Sericytochromatia bacterium]|nr:MAG: octanoyltransferase [Candidatus Sericytochromatia bacterium]